MTQIAQSSRKQTYILWLKFKRFLSDKLSDSKVPVAKVRKISVKRAVGEVAPPHSLNKCDARDAESRA